MNTPSEFYAGWHAGHSHSTDDGKTWATSCLNGCETWPCDNNLDMMQDALVRAGRLKEDTQTLADGMAGSVWSEGKLVQSFLKPNTVQRRLVTEWTTE